MLPLSRAVRVGRGAIVPCQRPVLSCRCSFFKPPRGALPALWEYAVPAPAMYTCTASAGLAYPSSVNRTRRHSREDLATTLRYHSEERFRLLVESVKDYAIFMLDTEGLVVSWNAGAERITGYTASEAVGAHVSQFYTAE